MGASIPVRRTKRTFSSNAVPVPVASSAKNRGIDAGRPYTVPNKSAATAK